MTIPYAKHVDHLVDGANVNVLGKLVLLANHSVDPIQGLATQPTGTRTKVFFLSLGGFEMDTFSNRGRLLCGRTEMRSTRKRCKR
jgi:hypothetical protein